MNLVLLFGKNRIVICSAEDFDHCWAKAKIKPMWSNHVNDALSTNYFLVDLVMKINPQKNPTITSMISERRERTAISSSTTIRAANSFCFLAQSDVIILSILI